MPRKSRVKELTPDRTVGGTESPAFASGDEYQSWAKGWCQRPCKNKDSCPILSRLFLIDHSVPPEFEVLDPDDRGPGRYLCGNYADL